MARVVAERPDAAAHRDEAVRADAVVLALLALALLALALVRRGRAGLRVAAALGGQPLAGVAQVKVARAAAEVHAAVVPVVPAAADVVLRAPSTAGPRCRRWRRSICCWPLAWTPTRN